MVRRRASRRRRRCRRVAPPSIAAARLWGWWEAGAAASRPRSQPVRPRDGASQCAIGLRPLRRTMRLSVKFKAALTPPRLASRVFSEREPEMTLVRLIGDDWGRREESGRRVAQAETRNEAEALEAQWLASWHLLPASVKYSPAGAISGWRYPCEVEHTLRSSAAMAVGQAWCCCRIGQSID